MAAVHVSVSTRTLRSTIGQLLMAGFPGHDIPVELRALAREFDLGGIVLFARNVAEPEQVAELAREAQQLSSTAPVWVGIDQEGGRVQRVKAPLTVWPAMQTLGRADDLALTRAFATCLAEQMHALSVSIDFAPVVDVLTRADNPAIGDRAFSDDADVVARHGAAVIETLQAAGLPACAKHFPGHGEASVDSHLDLPVLELPPDRFEHVEWVPFRAAIASGVAAIVTGHLLVPSLDEDHPATQSRIVLQDILRGQLGFEGVVFSDDMDMQAIAARHDPAEAAVRALGAGCDVLLQCSGDMERLAQTLEGVVKAAEQERLPIKRLENALMRQERLKVAYLSNAVRRRRRPTPTLGQLLASSEHDRVADRMREFA